MYYGQDTEVIFIGQYHYRSVDDWNSLVPSSDLAMTALQRCKFVRFFSDSEICLEGLKKLLYGFPYENHIVFRNCVGILPMYIWKFLQKTLERVFWKFLYEFMYMFLQICLQRFLRIHFKIVFFYFLLFYFCNIFFRTFSMYIVVQGFLCNIPTRN